VPTTKGDAAAVRSHIHVVPQCALNSYLVRPRLRAPDAPHRKAAYAAGDFIVHLAGHKGDNKAALFDYALSRLVAPPEPDKTPRCGHRHHRAESLSDPTT
jgi:hypothetical protein